MKSEVFAKTVAGTCVSAPQLLLGHVHRNRSGPQLPLMRLLYIISERWPTHRSDVVTLFGRYLPRHCVNSDIVAVTDPSNDPDPSWGGGVLLLRKLPGSRATGRLVKFLHNFHALMRADPARYAAVQVRDMPLTAAIGIFVAHRKQLPFFYWMSYAIPEGALALAKARGWRSGTRYLSPLLRGMIGKWLLYNIVLPRCDHLFVQSDQMLKDMAEKGIPVARMTPVPMGVDLETAVVERITPIDDPILNGRRVIVYLGTLNRSRRIEMLFDMIVLVSKRVSDVLLLILGSIDDRQHSDWLRDQCVLRGAAPFVYWKGWVPMPVAWRYLRRSEIGLSPFPRSYELDSCSPTKVVEYLALGLPVVVNSQPDQEKVVRESEAGLCADWSAEAFAEAAVKLLENQTLRARMGESGQKYVAERRSYDRLSAALAVRYGELCLRRSKRRSQPV